MLKIALTGGIATGKSYVLDCFRRLGIPCLDADELSHGVTAAGTEATQAIAARFGADILDAAGAVDRKRLGPIVFADRAARRDLEAIVHPAVRRAVAAGLRAFELTGGAAFIVVAIPLLYQSGIEDQYDRVVVTICDPSTQMERLAARGLSRDEARQRLAAQMPTEEKAARAGFVIRTDGSHEETEQQVEHIWRELAGSGRQPSGS